MIEEIEKAVEFRANKSRPESRGDHHYPDNEGNKKTPETVHTHI